jgi:hypothetical protein
LRLVKPHHQPAAGCLTGTLAGGKEIIARAGFPAFMSWISCSMAPRIRSTTPLMTSSSAGANGGCSGGGYAPFFFSMSFIMSISILVARKLALAD